jgi:hypothetical protein
MEAPTGFNDFNSQLRAEFSKNEGQASASEPASAPPSAAPATEPPAPATPPAPPAEAAPAPTQADRTYEKLIEARRAARAEQEALKAERAARQLDDASRAELEEYRQLKALAKEDPVYVAEKLGYKKPDEFAATLMDKGAMTPDRRRLLEHEAQASELRKEVEAMRRERQEEKVQAAYSARIREIQDTIATAPETYDLVNRFQAWPQVVQAQIEHWNHTSQMGAPEELPLEHALEQVEQHLFDSYVKRVAESPKLRGYSAGAQAPTPRVLPQAAPAARQSGPSQARPTSAAPSTELTEEQAFQKAGELLFRGQRF